MKSIYKNLCCHAVNRETPDEEETQNNSQSMELHRSLTDDEAIDLTQDESPDGHQENVDFVDENLVCFTVFIHEGSYVRLFFLTKRKTLRVPENLEIGSALGKPGKILEFCDFNKHPGNLVSNLGQGRVSDFLHPVWGLEQYSAFGISK